MMFLSPLFAQAPEAGGGDGMMTMIMIFAFVMIFFWFFMLRPQQKQEEKHRKMMESLDRNDRVFTVGGLVGTIHSIDREKNEVVLKVDDSNGTKVHFLISAISGKIPKDAEKAS